MAKVFRILSLANPLPDSTDPKTIRGLLALGYELYLIESKTYDLEKVCQNLIASLPKAAKANRPPILMVAPTMGSVDFSRGGVIDFFDDSQKEDVNRFSFLRSAYEQLRSGTWVEERFLWEIALHEFISALHKENPMVDVDSETLGAFWVNGKANFRERLRSGELSPAVNFSWGGEGIAYRRFRGEESARDSRSFIFGKLEKRVLAYHKILPTPLRSLTRAEVAELLQRDQHVDTSKRANRDAIIGACVANLKPGFFRKKSEELADLLERNNFPENPSVMSRQLPDGSFQLL